MISRSHLASRWRLLPKDCIQEVTLYERFPDSVYDKNKPITVCVAEKRPVSDKEEKFFESVGGSVKRRSWHFWVETMTATWDLSFDPWSVEIESEWLVKESNGDEWMIVSASSGLLDSHWKCPAVQRYGESIISA